MSKDFFKVKKGLNIKPSDPTSLTDLEDGDLIIDSTDGNKLKKYNSTKVAFEDVTTPGSAQALNLLTDASFETEDAQFDIAPAGQLFSFEEHGVGLGLYTPTNLQYLQVQNASANTLSISRDENHSADLQGKQGLLTIWLKTSSEGFKVGVRVDGVDPTQDSIDQLNVRADGIWRKYELPFVFGSTSIGYKVYSDTSQVNAIDIDNVYLGSAPDGYIQTINNVDTDWISYTPTFTGFGTVSSVDFEYKRVGDSIIVRGEFVSGTPTATEAQITLPSSLVIDDGTNLKLVGYLQRSVAVDANFGVLATGGDSFLNISQVAGASGGLNPQLGSAIASSGDKISFTTAQIPIQGWGTGRTDAVNQQTELTAATANELSAKILNNGTASIASQNYDFIDSVTRTATGQVNITFKSNIFSEAPSVTVKAHNASGNRRSSTTIPTTSGVVVITFNTSGTQEDNDFSIIVSKQGNDVNKNQQIIGKFEAIEEVTADLTAATENTFSGYADCISTGSSVFDSKYNHAVSTTNNSNGTCTVTYSTELQNSITQPLRVIPTIISSGQDVTATITSSTTTGFTVKCTAGGVNCTAFPYFWVAEKHDVDTNKSFTGAVINASQSAQEIADIVREDIISTDLCQVEAVGTAQTTLTANVTPIDFIEVSDNCNMFDSNTTMTAQKNSMYLFTGNARLQTASNNIYYIYVSTDGGLSYTQKMGCNGNEGSSLQKEISCSVFLNVGDKVQIRSNANATTSNTIPSLHNLNITELPDTASIVENLNQNPRVSLQDQYSEIEIEWGRWNGQQLYRRCFTVGSDITAGATTITTWDSGLKPKGIVGQSPSNWVIFGDTEASDSANRAVIVYSDSSGEIKAFVAGTWQVNAGTSFCMDYIK